MRTQGKNRFYHPVCCHSMVVQTIVAVLIILSAGCDDKDKSDKDNKDYWKDKQYELEWDLPAGGSTLRFEGFVFECTIGQLKGTCIISGTIPGDDGNVQIDIRDTVIAVTQTVPSTPQSVLSRSFDAHLTGTLIAPDNTTCDLTMNLHIEFDVDIEKLTGTLKYPATRITSSTLTCMSVSVPWPVPFSSLLTGDVALIQEIWPPCVIDAP